MNDLKASFDRDLDRVAHPPAWREVELRAAAPGVEVASARRPRGRIGAIVLAAALTASLVAGLVVVAGNEPTPAPTPVPDVIQITCLGGHQEVVADDEVVVQADGVHVDVAQGHTGRPSHVVFGSQNRSIGFIGVGDSSPQGVRSYIVSSMYVRPGWVPIDCYGGRVRPSGGSGSRSVEILDPDGLWVSTSMRCEPYGRFQIGSDAVDLRDVDRPEWPEAIRQGTAGLRPTDIVEPAGFPEAPVFRAVRNGEVIARYEVMRFQGRPFAQMDSCEGIGDPTMWEDS